MSENDFECFASTGVNTPETMSPSQGRASALLEHRQGANQSYTVG